MTDPIRDRWAAGEPALMAWLLLDTPAAAATAAAAGVDAVSIDVQHVIETAEGLANVEAIAATPNLTGLFVGPTDLSLDLHIEMLADFENEQLLDALDRVLDACAHHDLVAGIHAPAPDDAAAAMIGRGFRLVSFAVDTDVLGRGMASALRRLRPV